MLILGTGPSIVDYVLSPLRHGHQGQIVAMSRRGLLAKAHRRIDPMRFEADLALLESHLTHRIGRDLSEITRKLDIDHLELCPRLPPQPLQYQ